MSLPFIPGKHKLFSKNLKLLHGAASGGKAESNAESERIRANPRDPYRCHFNIENTAILLHGTAAVEKLNPTDAKELSRRSIRIQKFDTEVGHSATKFRKFRQITRL